MRIMDNLRLLPALVSALGLNAVAGCSEYEGPTCESAIADTRAVVDQALEITGCGPPKPERHVNCLELAERALDAEFNYGRVDELCFSGDERLAAAHVEDEVDDVHDALQAICIDGDPDFTIPCN